MLTNIRTLAQRLAGSSLAQNAGALALVQAASYLVPLITLPYLTRVLGVAEWGRVAWMQVILSYFTMFTDWGLSWSGVRKVAAQREDPCALSSAFFAGWAVQWMLCVLSLGVLGVLALFAPFFAPFRQYAFYGGAVIVAGVLFPIWLLTGLERIREVAVTQLAIRLGSVPLILLMVKDPGDGPLVIAITAAITLLGGIAALIWMWKHLPLEWRWPSLSHVRGEIFEGGSIFMSRVWITLYTTLIPTILGAHTSSATVGQYVLADRIRGAVQSILTPLAQALFPRMSYLFARDRRAALHLLWRSGWLMVVIAAAASLSLFLLADLVIRVAGGPEYAAAAPLLRWLSPLPLVVILSNIFGVQVMLPNQMTRAFTRILAAAGILSLVMIVPWVVTHGAEGAAINVLLTECFVTSAMASYLYRNRNQIS